MREADDVARYEITNEPAQIDFEEKEYVRRTVQNAKNLLMTRMGEVPYDRLRGFDHSLFDLPMTEFRARLMPEIDRVLLWEPDAEAVSAEANRREDGGTLIKVIIEVREG